MIASDCQVCSIKSACEAGSIYLYAPTQILLQRVELVLRQNSIPFSLHRQTFAVQALAGRTELLNTLQSQLSKPEAEDLRVTFDLANLMAATSLTQTSGHFPL